jgi:TolB-like protein
MRARAVGVAPVVGWLLALALLSLQCGGPRRFVHPAADIAFYERLALLPFDNLTAERAAGDKVTRAFLTELLIARRFDVVDPGRAVKLARDEGIVPPIKVGELTEATLMSLGERMGVQAVLSGVVREYTMVRIGQTQYPLITLDVTLVDTATGTTVWVLSHTKKGGPNLPFVSVGETFTLGELLQEICQETVSKIPR